MPSNQSRIIEQAKLAYYPLETALKNEQKQLKNKEKNNLKPLKLLKSTAQKLTIKDVIPE